MIILPTSSVATTAARIVATSGSPIMASLVAQSSSTSATTTALSALPLTCSTPAVTSMILRGGAAVAAQTVNLERTSLRLAGLHSYCIITTLLMGGAIRLCLSTPRSVQVDSPLIENIAKILFMLTVTLSIVSGSHTTIVFALLGLYSKTALGLGKDVAFLDFFAATASARDIAFKCFLCTLVSFNASFVLSIFLNTKGKQRWWTSAFAAFLVAGSIASWNNILVIAKRTVFA